MVIIIVLENRLSGFFNTGFAIKTNRRIRKNICDIVVETNASLRIIGIICNGCNPPIAKIVAIPTKYCKILLFELFI